MSDDILAIAPPPADTRLSYGSDPNQFMDLRFPARQGGAKKPYTLVINIHGGFWRARYSLDHAGHLCAAMTAKGFATANVEYRRVGNPGGGWPGTFEDLRSAYQFLLQNAKAQNFDSKRIVVIGHSAGGQLALCLAAHQPKITRVISLAGVVDLQRAYQLQLSNNAVVEFLGGTPKEVPDHYREADAMQLSIPRAAQWIIHGSADEIVPLEFSRNYVAAKKDRARENVQLLDIAGAGHFDLIDPRSRAWKRVEAAMLELSS
jgi:acetyl esterase/lipase